MRRVRRRDALRPPQEAILTKRKARSLTRNVEAGSELRRTRTESENARRARRVLRFSFWRAVSVLEAACAGPGASGPRSERRLVHRPRRREAGPRVHAFQRDVRRVLLPRDHAAGRRAVRLRQRRRPRRVRRAGSDARQEAAQRGASRSRSRSARTAVCFATIWRCTRTARARCISPTSPPRAASSRAATRWASRPAISTTTAASISTSRVLGPQSAVQEQLRRHVHRRFDGRAARTIRAGASRRRSSTTIATAVSISSSATTCSTASTTNIQCFSLSGSLDYCPPHVYRAAPSHLYHNNRDGTFTDVTAKSGMAARVRTGARRRRRRLQRRRLDRSLRRQRRPAEPALDQPARRHVQEHGAARRRGAEPRGRRPNRAWASTPATSTTTATRICSSRSSTGQGDDLYVNDGTGVFEDRSARAGIRLPSLPFTASAPAGSTSTTTAGSILVTVNGAVTQNVEALARNEPFSLQQTQAGVPESRQRPVRGRRRRRAGAVFQIPEVSRGARVRRHRQRRRRRHGRRQRQRAAAAAHQQRREPQALGRAAARRR